MISRLNNKRSRLATIFLVILLVSSGLIAAEDELFPATINRYVNDWAGLMTTRQAQQLEMQLRQFENATSNQFVVATFPSLKGQNLEDVSIRMYEAWRLGQKGRDNGVLLTVWKAERKIRIEVGYGLEPVLTDALSGRIIRDEMAPSFRRGDFYGGIIHGVKAIMAATRGEYTGQGSRARGKDDGGGIAGLLFPLLFFFLLFGRRRGALGGFLLGSMLGSAMGGRRGGFGGGGGFGGFSGGGGFGGGGGASGGW
ncbi:MAG: TPM domain-containing protein [Lentisphaeria bacterium]|nr:TPM domain-containing protein [Candidatus Neomarinimicrobiota bacterium]MCF7841869.1 TPM domain-containing protein [Lentisphaeria bacterium]